MPVARFLLPFLCVPALALAQATALPVQLPELNSVSNEEQPALSADGRFIAVQAYRMPKDGGMGGEDVYVFDRQEKKLLPVPALNGKEDDEDPAISGDGRFVACVTKRTGIAAEDIFLADRVAGALVETPGMNSEDPKSGNATDREPSLSSDGRLLAFASNRSSVNTGFDIFLYDVTAKKLLPLPGLNADGKVDESAPALSGDGNFIAFQSGRPGGVGNLDIYVYDIKAQKLLTLPNLNHKQADAAPALSGDGRLLAFESTRDKGTNVYLYDLKAQAFIDLPGVNDDAAEKLPALSADGKFLAYHARRKEGQGRLDIYLCGLTVPAK